MEHCEEAKGRPRLKYPKGSPEAKAYMQALRDGRRPQVTAVAEGQDFSVMTVKDERGNAAAVSISKEVLERQLMALEIRAEKRRMKKEEERDDLVKKALIGGGVAVAVWFLFLRPRPPAPPAKPSGQA